MANTKYKIECVIETDFDYATQDSEWLLLESCSNKEGFTEFIKTQIEEGLADCEHILSLTVTEV